MLLYIQSALLKELQMNILIEADNYHIGKVQSGQILFKMMIQMEIIRTWSNVNYFREKWFIPNSYMTWTNSYFKEFKEYLKINHKELRSHGKHCDIIMANIFKCYHVVTDRELHKYLVKKRGIQNNSSEIGHKNMMIMILDKYETLKY